MLYFWHFLRNGNCPNSPPCQDLSTRTLFPPSLFPHCLPVFLLLELLFSCCCHLFHFSNERDVAGEELSQSGDIFFEAQARKSSLFLGNKTSLLWYLTSTFTSSPAQDMLLLHCKSFGSDFLFNIVSIFSQTLTSVLNTSMFPPNHPNPHTLTES